MSKAAKTNLKVCSKSFIPSEHQDETTRSTASLPITQHRNPKTVAHPPASALALSQLVPSASPQPMVSAYPRDSAPRTAVSTEAIHPTKALSSSPDVDRAPLNPQFTISCRLNLSNVPLPWRTSMTAPKCDNLKNNLTYSQP
jgi:hypothetical protein